MRPRWAAGLASVAAALTLLSAGPASATIGPEVSLYVPQTRLDAGSRLAYTYHLYHVPHGLRAYLQRRVGPRRWEQVAALRGTAGRNSAPGMPMGRYGYRLAVYQGRRFAGASGTLTAYFYAPVSLAEICAAGFAFPIGTCATGAVPVGGSPLAYGATDPGTDTSYSGAPDLAVQGSSCRQATIVYAFADGSRATGDVYADLEQTPRFQQASRTEKGSVGVLAATIVSPDWELVFFTDGRPATVYWNATFMCWTASGRA